MSDLAKGYVGAQKLIGAKGVIIPGKDAPAEVVSAYRKAMGIPEAPDAYQVPKEGLPANVKLDEKAVASFRPEAHRLGLTEQQFAGLLRFQTQMVAEQEAAWSAQLKTAEQNALASLQKEFGPAFQERVALRDSAISQLGGPELTELLSSAGLINHPLVFKAFAKMGAEFAQDEVHGRGGARPLTMGPADAKAKMRSMGSDPATAKILSDRNHPQYRALADEWKRLNELASQGE